MREETEGMNASLINHCMSSLFCNYLVQIPAVKYLLTQLGQLYTCWSVSPCFPCFWCRSESLSLYKCQISIAETLKYLLPIFKTLEKGSSGVQIFFFFVPFLKKSSSFFFKLASWCRGKESSIQQFSGLDASQFIPQYELQLTVCRANFISPYKLMLLQSHLKSLHT